MNKPIVIQGSLVDVKNVNAHKCTRLSIDVPAELGAEIVKAFGWPTMAEPVPVAVARLVAGAMPKIAAPEDDKAPRPFASLPLPQQAALLCGREAFRRFAFEAEDYTGDVNGDAAEEQAAEWLRRTCGVRSRKDIAYGTDAGTAFVQIYDRFHAWMNSPEFAA